MLLSFPSLWPKAQDSGYSPGRRLTFFNNLAPLADREAFDACLAPVRRAEWVVYAKRPFGGPEAVLAYLSRYTHRIAISNSRLVAFDGATVTFRWQDYRTTGRERYKTMTLDDPEFIHRFLIHVLPDGFHRIRHYGLFANGGRVRNIQRARELLAMPVSEPDHEQAGEATEPTLPARPCPCCGGRMIVIETFERGHQPRAPPRSAPWIKPS